MDLSEKYEVVIGLEVHAQLRTQSKLFCGDSIAFGAAPNTHVSPITLAHPGSLPKMNEKVIEYAVKLGLACNCDIEQKTILPGKTIFIRTCPRVTRSPSIPHLFAKMDLYPLK